ncbi:hypothetical protein [Floricoccus penangensis]|uniref:hypothetical protein n=1 Tax=Floricoccus penangensis TaxID=1859475 RepID=UPI00203E2BD8|nr:hypothetical protein [Floricoccus penangensis]URZ88140.1 hypothetical protein KIW23_03655 [Floricoccus penangensis]
MKFYRTKVPRYKIVYVNDKLYIIDIEEKWFDIFSTQPVMFGKNTLYAISKDIEKKNKKSRCLNCKFDWWLGSSHFSLFASIPYI